MAVIVSESINPTKTIMSKSLELIKDNAMGLSFSTCGGVAIASTLLKEQGYLDNVFAYSGEITLTAAALILGGALAKGISVLHEREKEEYGPTMRELRKGTADIEKMREDRWIKRELKAFDERNKRLIADGEPPQYIYNHGEFLRSRYHKENIAEEFSEKFQVEFTMEYKMWKAQKEMQKLHDDIASYAKDVNSRYRDEQMLKQIQIKEKALNDYTNDAKNIIKDCKECLMAEGPFKSGQITKEQLLKAAEFKKTQEAKGGLLSGKIEMTPEKYKALKEKEHKFLER